MFQARRVYAYWPDKQGKSAWEKLDAHGPHAICHDEARDLHQFGSYVTGHLPRTHPLVENETLDDRALEGVWLGDDLSTPMFWMYSFKLRKVVRLSDPRHFDHILPFLCPEDIPHRIARCKRRMATRCNACHSVRARTFSLQLRGSQFLSLLTLVR